jgi:hypothetical protein
MNKIYVFAENIWGQNMDNYVHCLQMSTNNVKFGRKKPLSKAAEWNDFCEV